MVGVFHTHMTTLRIVTYNIAHGRGLRPIAGLASQRGVRAQLNKIARMLAGLKADVVCLQEIDQDSAWSGHFDHLEYLRRFARFPHAVFGVNSRRDGLFHFNYGNAILSRLPIADAENIAFGKRRVGEKGFLFAEIELGAGRILPVVNMHLHHRSRAHRLRQVERVMTYLGEIPAGQRALWAVGPVLCGDMNNPSHAERDATAALLKFVTERGGKYQLFPQNGERTYPSPLPRRTLDFVFLPPECVNASCHVVRAFLSDHRPVVVDCRLK